MTDAHTPSKPSAAAASGYPSRRSLREQQTEARTTTESIRLPFREHVPAEAAEGAAPTPSRPSVKRRIAALSAGASVCALVLTSTLPLIEQVEDTAAAAGSVSAAQELFSETTLDDLPTSFTEISVADTDEPIAAVYGFNPDVLVNYPFAQQVTLTDPFGYRTAPVEQFHDAQDFAASAGTPIQAIADGTVVEAGYANDGCGFGLKLEHEIDGQTVSSRYCHMQVDSHSYRTGDAVSMGDPVGKVGNTGMSFGPHLHLAIRVDDEPVDPMPFFSKYSRMKRPAAAQSAS